MQGGACSLPAPQVWRCWQALLRVLHPLLLGLSAIPNIAPCSHPAVLKPPSRGKWPCAACSAIVHCMAGTHGCTLLLCLSTSIKASLQPMPAAAVQDSQNQLQLLLCGHTAARSLRTACTLPGALNRCQGQLLTALRLMCLCPGCCAGQLLAALAAGEDHMDHHLRHESPTTIKQRQSARRRSPGRSAVGTLMNPSLRLGLRPLAQPAAASCSHCG